MLRCAIVALLAATISASPLTQDKIALRDVGSRIINGNAAAKGQFPWQAAVIFTNAAGGSSFCGGSLISTQWVLTAAHCTTGARSFTIYLGTITLGPDAGSTTVTTTSFLAHAEYNSQNLRNDIALVQFPSPITLTTNIQTIALGTTTIGTNVALTVSGWGKIKDSATAVSNTLNYVGLVSISNTDCGRYYGGLTTQTLCASHSTSTVQSTCNGDSGGPLITGTGSSAVHVGVVSFVSTSGCESGAPSGYVRTASYRDWIRTNSGV